MTYPGSRLSEESRKIISMRMDGLMPSEIAEELGGVSRKSIVRRLEKFKKLYGYEYPQMERPKFPYDKLREAAEYYYMDGVTLQMVGRRYGGISGQGIALIFQGAGIKMKSPTQASAELRRKRVCRKGIHLLTDDNIASSGRCKACLELRQKLSAIRHQVCKNGHKIDGKNIYIQDGRNYCRKCLYARQKAWREKNKEKVRKRLREYGKKYYDKNREYLRQYGRNRYLKKKLAKTKSKGLSK